MSDNITKLENVDKYDVDYIAKNKSAASLAQEIHKTLVSACPFGTTFIQEIPLEHRKVVEDQLRRNFEVWANSWVVPHLAAIVQKGGKSS